MLESKSRTETRQTKAYINLNGNFLYLSFSSKETGKEREETDSHINEECKKLAQNQYKNWRHDKVAQVLHWNLSKKFNLQCSQTWPGMTIFRRQ